MPREKTPVFQGAVMMFRLFRDRRPLVMNISMRLPDFDEIRKALVYADTNGVASDTVRRSSRSMERASIGLACYDPNRYETPALQPTSICAALKLVKVGLVISVRE